MKQLTVVLISRTAQKQIQRLPQHIQEAFEYWVNSFQYLPLRNVRKYSGYHDEPLLSPRFGQRSVRLNRSYRVIYIETKIGIEITVIEVHKHAY